MKTAFNESKVIALIKAASKRGTLRAKFEDDSEFAYVATDHFLIRTCSERIKTECRVLGFRDGCDSVLDRIKTGRTWRAEQTKIASIQDGETFRAFWTEDEDVVFINIKFLAILDATEFQTISQKYWSMLKIGSDDEWAVVAPARMSVAQIDYKAMQKLCSQYDDAEV